MACRLRPSSPPPPPPNEPESTLGELAQEPGLEPTQAMPPVPPTTPVDATQTMPAVPPATPPVDATQTMPVVASLPPRQPNVTAPADVGVPPPPERPVPVGQGPDEPWYRRASTWVGVVAALLIAGVIGAVFVIASGGDDTIEGDTPLVDGASQPVSLIVTRLAADGSALQTNVAASVTSAPLADDYRWIIPSDSVPGQPAIRPTDATGRAEFRWEPTDATVAEAWTSTVSIREVVGADISAIDGACTLNRGGTPTNLTVTTSFEVDTASADGDQIVQHQFPNVELVNGDAVACTMTNLASDVIVDPVPGTLDTTTTSTIVPETTTTTTTTVPETTTTTTTTVPETTTTTSTTSTTTTTTTLPADPSLTDVLAARSELSDVTALLERVGFIDELETGGELFTLLLPDNDAMSGLEFEDDAAVRAFLEAHIVLDERLTSDALAERTELEMADGSMRSVSVDGDVITVGGASIVAGDDVVDGGVVHVLDGVLA